MTPTQTPGTCPNCGAFIHPSVRVCPTCNRGL